MKRSLLIITSLGVAILICGGVLFLVLRNEEGSDLQNTTNKLSSTESSENNTTTTSSTLPVFAPEPTEDLYPNDTDRDGLTNEEEKKLGTNERVVDSDADGVADSIEVNRYKTNPTKADSDGDGYSDGREILSGYNPLGPGIMTTP